MEEIEIISANCQGLYDFQKKKGKTCYISTVNKNVFKTHTTHIIWNVAFVNNWAMILFLIRTLLTQKGLLSF